MAVSSTPSLDLALAFAQLDFPVFSVWGIKDGTCLCPKGALCSSPGKHPITGDGFKSATTDPDRIRTMLSNPGCAGNYGIVPFGRIIVIDADGEGWMAKLTTLGLPQTLTNVTANGVHLFFYWPESYGPVPSKLFGWIVRSENHKGYVIGPGSHHQSGVTYKLRRLNGETDLAGFIGNAISVFPVEKLPTPTLGSITVGEGTKPAIQVGEGERHDYLRNRAHYMHRIGMTDGAVWAAVMDINNQFPNPKTEEEVRRAIGDLSQFPVDPVPPSPEQAQEAQVSSLQTLLTLPYGTPPKPLVLDTFIAHEGWTVFYANGGTGKGLLALWMMRHVLFDHPDEKIAVLDYEGHRWEWGNRARAIGWTDEELDRVIYIDPYNPVWKKGETLAGIAPELRRVGDDQNVGLYVVDSYTMSAGNQTDMGGVDAAKLFFQAGAVLGKPGLTLAHTSAGEDKFPAKPFGSQFIHNLARETWAGAQVGSESGLLVKGQFGVTATSIQVELRNKKRSAGSRETASQMFDIEFRSNGLTLITFTQNYERPIRDVIADILIASGGSMTAKQLSAAIKEDTGRDVSEESVRSTIARGIDGLTENSSKRPKTYQLSEDFEA